VARSRTSAPATLMRPTWNMELGWQAAARCRGSDANLFFSPTHLESKDERTMREAKAKAICEDCAVRRPCLDFALATREPHGIWGGYNETDRRQLAAKAG
jgi:WhiB family transcriptional regulator, redox-sensing transcriptional regulator